MSFPFWLTGSRINSKILSKEDKAKMNWPLSNAHLLSYTLHGLHLIFICTTVQIHVFFTSSASTTLCSHFPIDYILFILQKPEYLFYCKTIPEPSRINCSTPFCLTIIHSILSLVCFLQWYRNSQSMVPETNSGHLQDQKHAHNNPTILLYFSLPFSQECIFEIS